MSDSGNGESGNEKQGGRSEPGNSPAKDDPGKRKTAPGEAAESGAGRPEAGGNGPPHPYEEMFARYPLRDPSEDPVWSVRIVKGWMVFLGVSVAGLLLLLVLGVFYH